MTDNVVRTRFAPSPTGPLHIGAMRQALFSWLFARAKGGQFILRIEDTDQERYVEGSLDLIYQAFDWFGLDIDEDPRKGGAYGPYTQSERLDSYQKWAQWLLDEGKAYKAFETSEELAKISEQRQKMGLPPGYDGRARHLTADEVAALEAEGKPFVIRFKMPREGKTRAEDTIRGIVEFENANLSDPVILKSDGFPTYHLAHVIDDHLMAISHVTRGVEWLPSLPIHWNLWEAFEWEKPIYAHLPLILNPNGSGKLSKRHAMKQQAEGDTAIPVLVSDFIELGYLPEATINFLTNIGWNFGDNREIFTVEETLERFELSDINKANSAYPIEKLEAINGEYIRAMSVEDLAERLRPVFEGAGLTVDDDEQLKLVTATVQERIRRLPEAVDLAGFFFEDWGEFEPPSADMLVHRKSNVEETIRCLQASADLVSKLDDFSHGAQYEAFKALAKELGVKNGVLFNPVRVAVTGMEVSPPTFESMEILGREESIRRLRMAITQLEKTTP